MWTFSLILALDIPAKTDDKTFKNHHLSAQNCSNYQANSPSNQQKNSESFEIGPTKFIPLKGRIQLLFRYALTTNLVH